MMSMLVLSWALSFGYVPMQSNQVNTECLKYSNTTMAKIDFSLRLDDRLDIYTSLENFQKADALPYFSPYRINYSIGAKLDITSFLSATIEHECDHKVVSEFTPTQQVLGMNETKLFVTFHGKTNFGK